jgi:hypothetical protein
LGFAAGRGVTLVPFEQPTAAPGVTVMLNVFGRQLFSATHGRACASARLERFSEARNQAQINPPRKRGSLARASGYFCYIKSKNALSLAIAANILSLLAGSPSLRAEQTWTDTRQVGPFVIQAMFPLAPFERLFAELPQLQRELTRTLGIPPATEPIYVYLFADESQYRAYTQQHFPRVPYRPALFILEGGSPGVYTFRKPEMDIDVRHECTHALLHAALPVVPLWLDEGIAKYFEMPAGQRAFDHPYFADPKWKWSLRLGMVRTIESLEQREDLLEMDAADYRYSWGWVHFMLHGPESAHRALVEYLASYRQWEPAGKLSVRLAKSVPNPTEQMIQHFKHWQQ